MKRSFGIIQALIIMVLVSFLLMIALKTASIGVKHVSDSYVKEQAELFMNTSIENLILAVEGYERNDSTGCLKEINFSTPDGRFLSYSKVLKYYCYDMDKCPNCDIAEKIETEDSHGTILVSTIVETNSSHPKNKGKRIKFSKVTVQRP